MKQRGDHALMVGVKIGGEDTINSMGLDTAALAAYDDPQFLRDVLERYTEWSLKMIEHVNALDVDLIVVLNDMADNQGPWFSPDMFREFFIPHLRAVASRIKKPWVYHGDGNMTALLPDLVTLGMNAIHPVQPPMDLGRVKAQWGDRLCLVGNIDIVHTLVRATTAEVEAEVRKTIALAAPGGGYVISSCPVITDYCKVENVQAMAAAIRKYGQYPLSI